MNRFILIFMLLSGLSDFISAKIVIYPRIIDKDVVENVRYKVFVREAGSEAEWQELQVIRVDVDMDTRSKAAMAQFDMDAPVEVKVSLVEEKFNQVKIRPLSREIKYRKIDENSLVFTMYNPQKLSIEFDGDRLQNLHLFANSVETEVYDADEADDKIIWGKGSQDIFRKDCRLIYFGPGVHQPKDLPNNEIAIPGNCTVYLAPGAVVKAKLRVDRVKNVRIIGRGMLFQPLRGVEITRSKNILVEGITIVNPMHYTVYGGASKNVTIRNIKSFSTRGWSDGIDLMCCKNWMVDDIFLRTSDDCLAFYNHRWWYWGGSKNLTVQNSILWADVAHAMNVGGHGDDLSSKGETMRNLIFRDIDVLNVDEDDDAYRGVMSICVGDKNHVKDILFEDIRVEDCEESRLIDVRVLFNPKYNREPGGTIRNVVFRNITYNGEGGSMYPMRIKGYSKACDVKGILMEDIYVNGEKMKTTESVETNEFVSDIVVR